MASWNHPELGPFKFHCNAWVREIPMLGFAETKDGTTEIELLIEADSESDTPSAALKELADQTIANHKSLLQFGIELLWNDFHGNGPDSGMWWHGNVEHIYEILDSRFGDRILDQPDGLYSLLEKASVIIQASGYGIDKPCSIIGFESPVDVEHGIGLLSDGTRIVGLGYRSDPDAYLLKPDK